ncbi:MAG: helix-hairpin-helix domain-containing protein [Pyrinomonadaceae bacterium]|nr:helix-hairpin-helix domain-containing protein [Pyrinomonadaceae bacterium]
MNINTATAAELQRLPHVGETLAGKIIEHRERHGAFRKPEHLMLVEGISDARFRRIRHLVSTE